MDDCVIINMLTGICNSFSNSHMLLFYKIAPFIDSYNVATIFTTIKMKSKMSCAWLKEEQFR